MATLKFSIPVALYSDKTYNRARRSTLLLIANLIDDKLAETLDFVDRVDLITNIELSCYNKTIEKCNKLMIMKSWNSDEFLFIYRIYTNNVTKNLDLKAEVKNNLLLDRIINGEINSLEIAFLSNIELFPERSNHITDKLNKRTNQKIKLKTTSMYTCRNCKGKCATMQEIQLRRIDESANTKLTCVFCNNSWFI